MERVDGYSSSVAKFAEEKVLRARKEASI